MSKLSTYLTEQPWMVTPERFASILGAIEAIESGRYAPSEAKEPEPAPFLMVDGISSRPTYKEPRGENSTRAVLVVPFRGTIYPRLGNVMPVSGGVNLQETMNVMRRAMSDPGVSSIVGDFDTPGGMVAGVPEAAAEIRSMRGAKPMTAAVNFQAASAGYYLASQFDEVVASPSSSLGSIGVLAQYVAAAKRIEDMGYKVQTLRFPDKKAEADGIAALSDEAVAFRMAQIKKTYADFETAVALGRRVTRAHVASRFGQGRSLDAAEAVAVKMADREGTLDAVISEHMSGRAAKALTFRRTLMRAEALALRWGFSGTN